MENLEDLLQLFENKITLADINSAKCLGEISAAIAKRRIELQMTQSEFAKYLGVSQGMVSKWESTDYNFTIKGLAEIAQKLGLEVSVSLAPIGDNVEITHITDASEIIDFRARTSIKE